MTDYVLFEKTNIVSGLQTESGGIVTIAAHYMEARSPEEAASKIFAKSRFVDTLEVFAVDDDSGRQILISCGKFSRTTQAISA
ncbi:MAG: hypothetical protein NUV96_01645 [Candidatus Colwellbacteria bacterium]|nr:hypothetical protein [Candidatus Colwellbacteria bacterium]